MTSTHDHGEELLEEETEAPDLPDVLPPMPVQVCDPVVNIPVVAHHPVFRTVILTSDNPFRQLLTIDPLRVDAAVLALDQDIVLSSSRAQAMSATNLISGLANPDGAILPKNTFPIPIPAIGEVWATAPTGYPVRVVVYTTRRSP